MADNQQIVIELVLDDSQLEPALDKLEKSGQIDAKLAAGFKQTNAELAKRLNLSGQISVSATREQQIYNKLVASLKTLSGESKKAVENLLKMSTGEVAAGFDKAAVSVDDYIAALIAAGKGSGDAEQASESLRQRLKELTEQITEIKLNGEQWAGQLDSLVGEAGRIKDAMADAGAEIKNAASDSRLFDNLLGSVQAVAGGFALVQGTAALFGDESKELQQTLLKVNAAMSILQGLQTVQNALQKEGAVSQLLANRQRLITNAQIAIENGLQSQSVIVRLAAAGAQRVLNVAMAANPVGILVVAIAGLIALLATYGRSAAAAARQTSALNVELEQGAKNFEDRTNAIRQQGDASIKALENQGATASRIAQQEIDNQKLIADARKQRLDQLRRLEDETTEADLDKRRELTEAIRKLEDEQTTDILEASNLEFKKKKILYEEDLKSRIAVTEAALVKSKEGSEDQLALQKQLINQRTALELNADGLLQTQRNALIAKGEKEKQELQADFDKRRIDLQLKNIDAQLVNVREGSQEEFNLRLQQLKLQTQSEITSTKLSESEKKAIREKSFQDQLKLQREFNERIRKEAIEGQISLNNAQLDQIKTNDEDRLLLTISNIELQAALEIDAAKGNATKIKEINAKRDADILAARKKFLEDQTTFEISIQQAVEGANRRALERIASDQRKSFEVRKAAISQLSDIEASEIDKRLALLEEEKRQKLISEKDYQLQYAQLQDQKKQVAEKTERDITQLTKDENALRTQVAFEALNAVSSILQGIADAQTARENQNLEDEKNKVQALLDAGAITEKEAKARNKRLEVEEKRLRREQAQRDKALAIFQAVINTADAVTKALASAPPPFGAILAGIAGALGAAQIALIANRTIPKFRTGKKNKYEGPGKIGEAGAELFEHKGRMYLAKKETTVWLGKDDKVYTPQETKQMLPEVDRRVMNWKGETISAPSIDYEQLGKSVGKHVKIPGIKVDENGFKVWQDEGMSRKNYMDKYYSSK